MLRTSSSTTSTRLSLQRLVGLVQALHHALLGRRQVGDHAVQEQRGLVEQALGRFHALDHHASRGLAAGAASSAAVRSLPVNTTIGSVVQRGLVLDAVEQVEAGHVRQAQVEHHAVVSRASRSAASASSPAADGVDLDVVVADQFLDAHALAASSSTTSRRLVRGSVYWRDALERVLDRFRRRPAWPGRRTRRARCCGGALPRR